MKRVPFWKTVYSVINFFAFRRKKIRTPTGKSRVSQMLFSNTVNTCGWKFPFFYRPEGVLKKMEISKIDFFAISDRKKVFI